MFLLSFKLLMQVSCSPKRMKLEILSSLSEHGLPSSRLQIPDRVSCYINFLAHWMIYNFWGVSKFQRTGISRGGGGPQKTPEMEITRGVGVSKPKAIRGRGKDIFWNHTLLITFCLLINGIVFQFKFSKGHLFQPL